MNKKFLFLLIALPTIPACFWRRSPVNNCIVSEPAPVEIVEPCNDYKYNAEVQSYQPSCQDTQYVNLAPETQCFDNSVEADEYEYEPLVAESHDLGYLYQDEDDCDEYEYEYADEDDYENAPIENVEYKADYGDDYEPQYADQEDAQDLDHTQTEEELENDYEQDQDNDDHEEEFENNEQEDSDEDEEDDLELGDLAELEEPGFKEIIFNFNEKEIKNDQEEMLKNNLGKIKQLALSGHKIVVEGHANQTPNSEDNNLTISRQRAESVANYLVQNGIDQEDIQILAHGSKMPLIEENGIEGQSLNSRVEIYSYKEA